MTWITVIFILLIAYSFGWKEVAYSFFDIHVGHVVKVRWFAFGMLLAMGLGMAVLYAIDGPHWEFRGKDTFILTASMTVTIALLWMIQRHFSSVTAFWGALFALQVIHGNITQRLVVCVVVSLLVAPCVAIFISLLLRSVIRRRMQTSNSHLMVKFWWVKCILYLGILVCGIALTFNYSMLVDALLSGTDIISGNGVLTVVLMVITCCVCLAPVFLLVYYRRRKGILSNTVASLFSQAITLLLFNIVLPILTVFFTPIIISVNLLKECNTIAMERGKEIKRLINVLTIVVVTPLLSFVVALLLTECMHDRILTYSLLMLVFLSAVLVRLYYFQLGKQRFANSKLHHELQYKSEMNKQLNRLDVAAVTSQFNSLSTAMDFKQKELINLSLYINQQSDYMKEVERRIERITAVCEDEKTSSELRMLLGELHQNLRMNKEVDSLYQEVEEKHRDFVSRLQMRCPSLSPRERRLAILLRLGLSSKEIASMMSLEPKSVEINRYRLRKKLKLDRSENIVHLLQMI